MNSSENKVGILGAGQWGTTLAILASKTGARVFLYDRSPEKVIELQSTRANASVLPGVKLPANIEITNDIGLMFTENTLLMPVIPAKVMREFTTYFKPHLKPHHMIVHGSKGLEPHTHMRMSEVIKDCTGSPHVGALSGPNLAVELAKGLPGATVVASASNDVILYTQKVLASSHFRVYGNTDLVGVEWTGSLKNILAIAAGAIHELGFGQNVLAMLITRGLAEMSRLIIEMGGHSSSLLGLAGIGDIITTCTSPLSRNFRAGQMLAHGKVKQQIEKELAMTVEGFNTIEVVADIADKRKVDLPITLALLKIILDGKSIKESMQELMERPLTFEFEFE